MYVDPYFFREKVIVRRGQNIMPLFVSFESAFLIKKEEERISGYGVLESFYNRIFITIINFLGIKGL